MTTYLVRRLAQAIPVLLVGSFIVFLVLHLVPGDPADAIAGPTASDADIERIRATLGLDRPLLVQYVAWLGNAVTGDLGESYINGISTVELLRDRIPPTLLLIGTAIAVSLVLALGLGIVSALQRGRLLDTVISGTSTVMLAVPNFWLAILGILAFGLYLGLLPVGDYVSPLEDPVESARHLVLPVLALAGHQTAVLTRFVRGSMNEVLSQGFMKTTVAKGLRLRYRVVHHALRNALLPVVTVVGFMVGRVLAGAVVIESVFAWPGVGRLLIQSIESRDYAVVQGCLLLLVVWFVLVNVLVDLAYAVLDPRIRLSREGRA